MNRNAASPLINPYLAVVLAVLACSFSSIFTKLSSAPPLVIAFYRLFFTVIFILPVALDRQNRREIQSLQRKELILAMLAGIFLALHFGTWITSLTYTSISSSTVLVCMQPLFVIAGGAFFLGEKLGKTALFGAAVTVAGSLMIGFGDFQTGGKALYGDFLAFSGALFIAAYVLIGGSLRKKLSLFPYVVIVYISAAVVLGLSCVAAGNRLYPYPGRDWLYLVGLALVPTILGHTVFNWALRYVKAAVISVSILGEPIGASILAFFIFHQVPGLWQVVGGLLLVTGLYAFIWSAQVS